MLERPVRLSRSDYQEWTTCYFFLGRIHEHYLAYQPSEQVFGNKIRSDKARCRKFNKVNKSVVVLNESGTSTQDVIDCVNNLYKIKHQKQQPFF